MLPRHTLIALALTGCTGVVSGSGDDDEGGGGDGGGDPVVDPADLEHGLRGTYHPIHGDAALDRIDAAVDFAWGEAEPAAGIGADHFSVRWTGYLDVPAAGSYTFAITADDGVRLRVDGAVVIEDWTFHAPTLVEGAAELPAGFVELELEYFDVTSNAEVHLGWRGAGVDEPVLPTERLRAAPRADASTGPKPPFVNPVIPFDCPDPGVAATGDGYVMVCTGGSFPVRRSADLIFWQDTGGAILPDGKPAWAANGGRNWAPEIHQVGEKWIAYFTSVNGGNVLSVGAAAADAPEGPYVDRGGPLVEAGVGVIDATYFRDEDGAHYLLYKIDGNSQGQATPIYIRALAPDGLSFAEGSAPVEILRNDGGTWEGGVVEAPWLVKRDGTYYLFYSGNVYDERYRTGVARASAVTGPYEKHGAPILANNGAWVGPGHGSVVPAGALDYFVYHAWRNDGAGGNADGGRHVLVQRIDWADGWPHIGDGTPATGLEAWPGE
ncbi:MAG TPA: family 43 glycosylhydrolase [Kofleriaceae bacterium]|nr:family 43 glycosylhydrolase [Kofleriaceae bacterium]